jgi:hypothetical protein
MSCNSMLDAKSAHQIHSKLIRQKYYSNLNHTKLLEISLSLSNSHIDPKATTYAHSMLTRYHNSST